jgi:hypothetical protein
MFALVCSVSKHGIGCLCFSKLHCSVPVPHVGDRHPTVHTAHLPRSVPWGWCHGHVAHISHISGELYACELENMDLRCSKRDGMPGRVFGPKRDEVTGGCKELHNYKVHNLYLGDWHCAADITGPHWHIQHRGCVLDVHLLPRLLHH